MNLWIDRLRRTSASGPGAGGRLAARAFLVAWGVGLASFVMFGPPLGSTLLFAQASPSPTGTSTTSPGPTPTATGTVGPGPGAIAIQFLNPSSGYNPRRQEDPTTRPKISDRFDGINSTYHIVAVVSNPPQNALVEAYIASVNAQGVVGAEQTIGLLQRNPLMPDTWELEWDVPDSLAEPGAGSFHRMIVRLYTQSGGDAEEVAKDEQDVDLEHRGGTPPTPPDPRPADETVELTWPQSGDRLGFYRGRGVWRTTVDFMASSRAEFVHGFYSVTPIGKEPVFTECFRSLLYNTPQYEKGDGDDGVLAPDPESAEPIPFSDYCALAAKDLPSQVTSIAVVTGETDQPERNESVGRYTQDSGDVHRVTSYIQQPGNAKVTLTPIATAQSPDVNRTVRNGTTSNSGAVNSSRGCLAYDVFVQDSFGRPISGANIDVHVKGPTDAMQFAVENPFNVGCASFANCAPSGTFQAPDKGHPNTETGKNCDSATGNQGAQADQNIPGGPDIKHRESLGGTSVGGGGREYDRDETDNQPGHWWFHLFSRDPGFTDITVWIDDEPVGAEGGVLVPDDDLLEPTEPFDTERAQWFPQVATVTFEPAGASSNINSCFSYLLRARAGAALIPGANLDIHAQGPSDEVDFCDPEGGSAREAPDQGDHLPEDVGEAQHPAPTTTPPSSKIQHTEGNTDEAGNFLVGLTSPVTGGTTLQAWLDGEPEHNNDVLVTTERSGSVTHSWTDCTPGNAKVGLLNPTNYGQFTTIVSDPLGPRVNSARNGGTNVSNKSDADDRFHVMARVDCPDLVPQVDIQIATSSAGPFTSIGLASRVGTSDAYELLWNVSTTTDGAKVIRAVIPGTSTFAEQAISVNSKPPGPDDQSSQEAPFETAEISKPANGAIASFARNKTTVEGLASAGADAVDFFYTKLVAKDTPRTSTQTSTTEITDWVYCGFVPLSPGASGPQAFKGDCALAAGDQASQVTGIAALAFDCENVNECERDPMAPPRPQTNTGRGPGNRDSGDAHRVIGVESSPVVTIEPPESEAPAGFCQKFVVKVTDSQGQALGGENVDLHLAGPADDPDFCNPDDGSASSRSAPDTAGHIIKPGQEDEGVHEDSGGPDAQHTEGATGIDGKFVIGVLSEDVGDSNILAWLDRDNDEVDDAEEPRDTAVMHWTQRAGACTIEGTPDGEVIDGTDGDDVICSRGGNDVVRGFGGNDVIKGGRGSDRLFGGAGDDQLFGRVGHDRLTGGPGSDTLRGGPGRDRLDGRSGIDACFGGRGRDRLRRCE